MANLKLKTASTRGQRDDEKAAADMRLRYSKKSIAAAFRKHKIGPEFEVGQLMALLRSTKTSPPTKLQALSQLRDLRFLVDDSRLSSRVYKRMPAGPPVVGEGLDPDMLAEAALVE